MSGPRHPNNEGRIHVIARRLVFEQFGDWRYDPGDPRFRPWFMQAKRVLKDLRDYERTTS